MIFNHEHQHPPSTIRVHEPTPMWAKLACAASMLLVITLIGVGFK